ncbi:MAG: endonuclease YncB(thermonuclease family) [Verrucomicrobiales bacterium]|jgi:endonuclease YncB( thermonuclease family)
MEQRTHGFSLIVTVAVLGALTVVAWLYKVGKNEEARALRDEVAENRQQEIPTATEPRSREFQNTNQQDIKNRNFEVLMGCELVESRANDGSTLRIRHRDNEYVFRLYFVDTPETTLNNGDIIRSQTRYFNYITEERLLETGAEAREFALKLLRSRPFAVFTQWLKPTHNHRYYGMVQIQMPNGERRFLSELLASRGYATLDSLGIKLPNGVEEEVFRNHLHGLETVARKSSVGAWRSTQR